MENKRSFIVILCFFFSNVILSVGCAEHENLWKNFLIKIICGKTFFCIYKIGWAVGSVTCRIMNKVGSRQLLSQMIQD